MIEEHLERLRTVRSDEKLKHFVERWGPELVSQLIKRDEK